MFDVDLELEDVVVMTPLVPIRVTGGLDVSEDARDARAVI